eukprot:1810043-Rhodomonas_salina.4
MMRGSDGGRIASHRMLHRSVAFTTAEQRRIGSELTRNQRLTKSHSSTLCIFRTWVEVRIKIMHIHGPHAAIFFIDFRIITSHLQRLLLTVVREPLDKSLRIWPLGHLESV